MPAVPPIAEIHQDESLPIVAAAIHNGHAIRRELLPHMALSDQQRLREEDPYTGQLARVVPTHIVGNRSRFEVDLNRPREHAVYQKPEDAWGLSVWQRPLSPGAVARSLGLYDTFYFAVDHLYRRLFRHHPRIVVLDLHAYNHRRRGFDQPAADPQQNPEVNIGTGSMPRPLWAPLVDRFNNDLANQCCQGHLLDVRENVKFFGGNFCRWTHQRYPQSACAIAVEFKKEFMDEWTGDVDPQHLGELKAALAATLPGLTESLQQLSELVQRAPAGEPHYG